MAQGLITPFFSQSQLQMLVAKPSFLHTALEQGKENAHFWSLGIVRVGLLAGSSSFTLVYCFTKKGFSIPTFYVA